MSITDQVILDNYHVPRRLPAIDGCEGQFFPWALDVGSFLVRLW